MRSDHLKAVLTYALEQMKTNQISVLDFGDNENDLNFEEQVEEVNSMMNSVDNITVHGHTALQVLEWDNVTSLLLDSMVLNFSRDSSLEEIKDFYLRKYRIDEELIEEVYELFKDKE